jgi:hypothetical protein
MNPVSPHQRIQQPDGIQDARTGPQPPAEAARTERVEQPAAVAIRARPDIFTFSPVHRGRSLYRQECAEYGYDVKDGSKHLFRPDAGVVPDDWDVAIRPSR